jgi:2'-5' RNA ligase
MTQLPADATPSPPSGEGRSLFVGLFPSPEVAEGLAQQGAAIVDTLGLRASRVIRPERLHVTLHFLGRFAEPPHDLVERAVQAVSRVDLVPVDLVFDAAHGFGGGAALGLCAGPGDNGAVRALRIRVGGAFEGAGVTSDPRFDPHLTVAYLARRFGRAPVGPVRWDADEVRLAFTAPGQRAYDTLARWPLGRSR